MPNQQYKDAQKQLNILRFRRIEEIQQHMEERSTRLARNFNLSHWVLQQKCRYYSLMIDRAIKRYRKAIKA